MEALLFPLSSRAKPRDLQFYRLILEMFFRGRRLDFEARRADRQRQPSPAGMAAQHRFPNLVWAP